MSETLRLKNRLKVARAEKNLSQEQLVVLAGVTRQTISSIETGQYCPTTRLALILLIVLNKQFEDIFYFFDSFNTVISLNNSYSPLVIKLSRFGRSSTTTVSISSAKYI